MTQRTIIAALLVAFISTEASAQNRTHRRRGALLGGLAGAAIGAAIGDKGNNETAGALVGGAVGAIAGGAIGNQKDQRIEHNQRYHSGHHYVDPYHGYHHVAPPYPTYRQPNYGQPIIQPVTVADVIAMQQRGLSELTIIRLIQSHGIAGRPSVSQVIDMHQYGVSERVIAAMQGDPIYQVPDTQYQFSPPVYDEPTMAAPLNGR